jgi:hypothetical protein
LDSQIIIKIKESTFLLLMKNVLIILLINAYFMGTEFIILIPILFLILELIKKLINSTIKNNSIQSINNILSNKGLFNSLESNGYLIKISIPKILIHLVIILEIIV